MAKMKLYEVRDWLETLGIADKENYYIGINDDKQDKSIGVYDRSDKTPEKLPIGGREMKKDDTCKVSILLHWTDDARETIDAADALVEKIQEVERGGFYIGEHIVDYIEFAAGGAVDIITDKNGIYERVLPLDIHYSI